MLNYYRPDILNDGLVALSENSWTLLARATDFYPARVGKHLNEKITDLTGIRELRSIRENNLENILVVGICTDICVMDFVFTLLSVRNHGMIQNLKEVIVYDKGCSTYSLPRDVAEEIGLPPSVGHPQDITNYMSLYFMASRGAQLVDRAIV